MVMVICSRYNIYIVLYKEMACDILQLARARGPVTKKKSRISVILDVQLIFLVTQCPIGKLK